MPRTFILAQTTLGAFCIVDGCPRTVDTNGTGGTGTLAKATGDTSRIAKLPHLCAAKFGGTSHPMCAVIGNELYYTFRTGANANAAPLALVIIHNSHAVYNGNGTERTCRSAGSETYATVGANLIPAAEALGGNAIGGTRIGVFKAGVTAAARAHDLRTATHGSLHGNAHYTAYFFGNLGAAHNAGSGGCLTRRNGGGKRGASRFSATAAVCAGQDRRYFIGARIAFNFKYF